MNSLIAYVRLFVMVFHINRITGDNLWSSSENPLASSVSTAGGTGVTLFFVLSGFLLFMPFAKALLFNTQWPLNRVFYLRRFLRIIPGYYVSWIPRGQHSGNLTARSGRWQPSGNSI